MSRPSRLAPLAYGLAVLVIALDQLLKYWVLEIYRLPERAAPTILGPLKLSMVWNRGVSFGFLNLGTDWTRWALSGFSIAVATALAVWARRVERPLLAMALGLVMGGAIGNVIDRIRFGAVTDFIDFSRLYFPWVFNIADSAITVGVVLILGDSLIGSRRTASD
ncbi:MAG: signal peptidase II [Caulobacteraceae bacterium]|nr:signal peptidase II [Caulobacteraceae bacterium]